MRTAGADNLSHHRGTSTVSSFVWAQGSASFRRYMENEDCILTEGCCPSVGLSTLSIWEVLKDIICEGIIHSVQTALIWFCIYKWASHAFEELFKNLLSFSFLWSKLNVVQFLIMTKKMTGTMGVVSPNPFS